MKRITCFLMVAVFVSGSLTFAHAREDRPVTDEAQDIYQRAQDSVYQIRIIDVITGNKSSIGSGFQISKDGYIATNFHVIAQAIHAPERYRIQYVRYDGQEGDLAVSFVDVVRDLAVLKGDGGYAEHLPLGASGLMKGARVFSMGNPFDLGMTIVEGIHNGLMEESLYQKILFSGSINPGMSGGPALSREGEVIGVNVATAGNQVSFLVPVEHLKELYQKALALPAGEANFEALIETQLKENQAHYITQLMQADWQSLPVGQARVPGEMAEAFKCWSVGQDVYYELFDYADIHCSTEDNIFISSTLSTGKIIYQYRWLESQGLSPVRFYNLMEDSFNDLSYYTNAQKDDMTNFTCDTQFVTLHGTNWKTALCARRYKKYASLYDINLSMASVDDPERGLIVELIALGVQEENIMPFMEKFMGAIHWQK